MSKGKIVEEGPVAEVFGAPQHDYTRRLLAEPEGQAPPVKPDPAQNGAGEQGR
jgi:microcin C transport system ATP-binding protein